MALHRGIATLIFTILLPSIGFAQDASYTDFNNCCNSAQDATAFAIMYGTPLVAYTNFTAGLLQGIGGPNRLIRELALSNPDVHAVVKPNVDTLYTVAFIDLSQSDLILTIPPIDDGRYWLYPFYDPYGDQFAELSSVNGATSGDYLVRRADDAMASPGLEFTRPTTSCIPKYQGIINYPTTYGTLLVRILAGQNNTEQLAAVNAYQKATSLVATPRILSNPNLPKAPTLTPELLNTSTIADPSLKALTLLARLGLYNQPPIAEDRYRIGQILGQAGISNNAYRMPPNVNLAKAASVALTAGQNFVRNLSNLQVETNGWVIQKPQYQGNFDSSYLARLYIAVFAYLEVAPSEALYPIWAPAALSGTSITTTTSYLLTFFGRPPLAKTGFWSLTAYDADSFLIPNSLGRYEVGDRSNITYDDGSPVYPAAALGSGGFNTSAPVSNSSVSRPFQVLIQAAEVAPPKNWTGNWLPGPSVGGDLQFLLRWYAPSVAFTNGSYEYPLVQKIAAIVA